MVNFLYPYVILVIHLNDADWLERMKAKVWFRHECDDALKQALVRAKEIQKNVERSIISNIRAGNPLVSHKRQKVQ